MIDLSSLSKEDLLREIQERDELMRCALAALVFHYNRMPNSDNGLSPEQSMAFRVQRALQASVGASMDVYHNGGWYIQPATEYLKQHEDAVSRYLSDGDIE